MDFRNRIVEINNLISLNKFSQALSKCEILVKKFPNNSYLLNLQGLILQQCNQVKKSIICFNKALSAQKDNYAAMNNLANSYKNLFEFEEAENLYKTIIRNDVANVKALNNYANLKREINQYQEAKKLLLKGLKIEPKNINLLLNLAICCQGIGEMNEAKNYLSKILDIQPSNTNAHKLLSTMINYNKDQTHLAEMKKFIDDKSLNSNQKTELFFALGKAHEDLKDYENSFQFLKKANSIQKRDQTYLLENTKKIFDNIIKIFDNIDIIKPKPNDLNKNIFICGMPRSGTTLIEQMVASHNSVEGAGEIHYLSEIIKNNFLEGIKFNKSKILDEIKNPENLIFKKYNNLINFHNFKSNFITDKAPQNFMWIGFIKIFFPNSKIIHCFRNPKDNCLSIFKNHFSSPTMSWAYDQKNIAEQYILYSRLMDYWKSKFKDDIFDANYEKIINSPEEEVKKIISFCDLPWDPECLNFHKNKKTPVQTVSVAQASKPIYKSSIQSNEPYVKYLSEMFNILDTNL